MIESRRNYSVVSVALGVILNCFNVFENCLRNFVLISLSKLNCSKAVDIFELLTKYILNFIASIYQMLSQNVFIQGLCHNYVELLAKMYYKPCHEVKTKSSNIRLKIPGCMFV